MNPRITGRSSASRASLGVRRGPAKGGSTGGATSPGTGSGKPEEITGDPVKDAKLGTNAAYVAHEPGLGQLSDEDYAKTMGPAPASPVAKAAAGDSTARVQRRDTTTYNPEETDAEFAALGPEGQAKYVASEPDPSTMSPEDKAKAEDTSGNPGWG